MTVTAVRLGGRPDLPLLVLGPSLGTSATTLWSAAAEHLGEHFQVLAWDLPGHGHNRADVPAGLSIADLARDVLEVVDATGGGLHPPSFHYAGDSIGGAVGLQLLLDAPDRVHSATLLCTGARIGSEESWRERIETVAASGTPALVGPSAERWFAPGFLEREPERGSALLHALSDADDAGYAAACGALATFDVRDRLGEIATPVLAVAGAHDAATPPADLELVAGGVRAGRLVVLPDAAHLAPAECPVRVAGLIRELALGPAREQLTLGELHDAGMAVRREVLGDAHVDRAMAGATDLTREFQEFITTHAWGAVWTRPGLDRRSRSMITLTALVARGHHDELALHLQAARRNGVTLEEIREVLLQAAVYCGVPDANTAFRIAAQTLAGDPGSAGPPDEER